MQRIYKMQFFSVDTRYPLLNLGTTVLITEFKTYTYKEKKWPHLAKIHETRQGTGKKQNQEKLHDQSKTVQMECKQ